MTFSNAAPSLMGLPVMAASYLTLWLACGDIIAKRTGRMRKETVAVWLTAHASMMMLCWFAPVGAWITCGFMLFCIFIFRLTLMDQLTGLLPREMTVSCLAGGLLFAAGNGYLSDRLIAATVIWCVLYAWRTIGYWRKNEETLGLGDVWFGSALAAWLGLELALYAIALGSGGFYLCLSFTRRRGGPVGPWLGGSALIAMIFLLYKPSLMW